jgi:hypothetical protein
MAGYDDNNLVQQGTAAAIFVQHSYARCIRKITLPFLNSRAGAIRPVTTQAAFCPEMSAFAILKCLLATNIIFLKEFTV